MASVVDHMVTRFGRSHTLSLVITLLILNQKIMVLKSLKSS